MFIKGGIFELYVNFQVPTRHQSFTTVRGQSSSPSTAAADRGIRDRCITITLVPSQSFTAEAENHTEPISVVTIIGQAYQEDDVENPTRNQRCTGKVVNGIRYGDNNPVNG